MSATDWSELGVSGLPTGTVTLLLADVEGSTRLWDTQPDEMTTAVARLDQVLADVVAVHQGVRPVEQGEGDSFVIAFARASDAVCCALTLQQAPLAPIRLRIGLHTGEVQLRDEANYIGPTINRAARLRNLAHGGQTVMSGATELLVVDQLPDGVWLTGLGTYPLRGLPRPERVTQLCHPDLCNEFPPLCAENSVLAHNLPVHLTSFVGRRSETSALRKSITENRLVTLTGAGGAGKTRLAAHVATEVVDDFGDGLCYVDLAPVTQPDVVPITVARAMGLPDQPGRSTMDILVRFVRDRRVLVILDNCEHLLDACAALVVELLAAAPGLTLLATSREPLGVAGEAIWQVPSLSLADDAIELFCDRARLARADFALTEANTAAAREICHRLDGIPLAIELAAARVRALSLDEIVDGLHDRFRLLTGGSRTSVRRQQTLRASMDWSYALLTDTEQVVFRRLCVFLAGFGLDAALAVAGADGLKRHQVLDQLTLLVDKSLVSTENSGGRTRYRLLETMRQYGLEKLGESEESDAVRSRHRDYCLAMAARLDAPAGTDYQQCVELAEIEIDNLRAAFSWCLESHDTERGLMLASSLQPLWYVRGRVQEGRTWFDAVLAEDPQLRAVAPAVRARALADKAVLDNFVDATASLDQAERALAIARELDDPALLARTLTGCGYAAGQSYDIELAQTYFVEAIGLARALDDRWRLSQILAWQAIAAIMVGDLIAGRATAEEGRRLADAIGDRTNSRACRPSIGWAQLIQGEVAGAVSQFTAAVAEADAAHDALVKAGDLMGLGIALVHSGDVTGARAAADAGLAAATELSDYFLGMHYTTLTNAALADGDVEAAQAAGELASRYLSALPQLRVVTRGFVNAETALAGGDLQTARAWTDEAVALAKGYHRDWALLTRVRVAIAEGERDEARRDAHDALAGAATGRAYLLVPNIFEVLADLTSDSDAHRAARLLGAAEAMRQRCGAVRYRVHDNAYDATVAGLRDTMDPPDFDTAWAEGAALSTEEAIAYALRGRGERKRPSSGWAALTPAELDVVRLVWEGLANKDIASRLFISPRTVQTHLAHVFAKLGVTSRVQLVHEVGRRIG